VPTPIGLKGLGEAGPLAELLAKRIVTGDKEEGSQQIAHEKW
jgi:hypothetical protein